MRRLPTVTLAEVGTEPEHQLRLPTQPDALWGHPAHSANPSLSDFRSPLRTWLIVIGLLAVVAAHGDTLPRHNGDASAAASSNSHDAAAIRAYMSFLADDALEGRRAGTRGYDIAAAYLRSQLVAFGASGGAEDGSYFQKVPLVRTRVDASSATFSIQGREGTRRFEYGTDYLFLDTHGAADGKASGKVIFVGYGVTAPHLNWDDYAGLDVRGAIVAYMASEGPPSFPPTQRAYYSDHEVKRAIAAQHGAIGAIAVASPETRKRFPWAFVLREVSIGWNSLRWVEKNGAVHGVTDGIRMVATLNQPTAEALFDGEAHQLGEIFDTAAKRPPPRFVLSKTVTGEWRAQHDRVESANVIGRYEGSDPALKNEYVVYTAHADHLGKGPPVDGDDIYNGALDNAAGCAVLLAVARDLGTRRERPARSILIVFVTAEEAGLLGSDYFAQNPPVPIRQIVANVNVDGGIALTPVKDVLAWGAEHSTLGTALSRAAARAGLGVGPDPFPEEGFFVRSDQFSFVQQGVPSIFVDAGVTSTDSGVDGLALLRQWLVTNYHSPKDDMSQPFDYGSSARFAQFVLDLGREIADAPSRPRWNEGDFFGSRFRR